MPDYSKGQIYKIVDIGYNKCYIGSTVEKLYTRMAKHKYDYKQYLNGHYKGFTSVFLLFDEYGLENCKIEWIEDYPCENKKQLHKREGQYQKDTDCVNKLIAGRSFKEHYEENKEVYADRQKQYYEKNKDNILEYNKQYYQENKYKINERNKNYTQNNKEYLQIKSKQYREERKEEKKLTDKKYYDEHKEYICETMRQKRKDNPEKFKERDKQAYQKKK